MNRSWMFLLCLASFAAAAEGPGDYAYALPIEGVASEALYRVAIPRVVHEAAAFPDLRDLRVFNGAGDIVPYALRPPANTDERRAPVALPFYALRGPRGARVEDLDLSLEKAPAGMSLKVKSRYTIAGKWGLLGYLVDASQLNEPLSALAVDWAGASDGYSAAVRVEGSEDLKHWAPLGEDAQLLSLSRAGQRLERKTVDLRPQRARYLRIAWQDPARTVELKTVLGVRAERGARPERVWKRVVATQDAGRSGDYRIDIGGLFPLDRLALRLPQADVVVPVEIFSRSAAADEWTPVARTLVYRVSQNGAEVANADVSFAPNSHRYWLLRADGTGGGFGLQSLVIRAGWIPREIVFAARGAAPFTLAYGNAKAKASAVPIESLVPGWQSGQEPPVQAASTGAPRGRGAEAAGGEIIDTERMSLWAALALALAALVWVSWRRRRANLSDRDLS
jgi:hypothetical protein